MTGPQNGRGTPVLEFTVVGPGGLLVEFADFAAARRCAEGLALAVLLVFGPGAEPQRAAWLGGDRTWYTSVWGGSQIADLGLYLGV